MSSEQLCCIAIRSVAPPTYPVDGVTYITGYVVKAEPVEATPKMREILRPVQPDEPDPETEIAYSKNALEPLTLVYQDRKVKLTESLYVLFRYIYDLYRLEGRTEFEFAEISELVKGDEFDMSKKTIEQRIQRLPLKLTQEIHSKIDIIYKNEVIYIENKNVPEK